MLASDFIQLYEIAMIFTSTALPTKPYSPPNQLKPYKMDKISFMIEKYKGNGCINYELETLSQYHKWAPAS